MGERFKSVITMGIPSPPSGAFYALDLYHRWLFLVNTKGLWPFVFKNLKCQGLVPLIAGLKMPPVALPGIRLAKQVSLSHFWFKRRIKGECDLPRGTRGRVHSQPAFKVAHLDAGGPFFGHFNHISL